MNSLWKASEIPHLNLWQKLNSPGWSSPVRQFGRVLSETTQTKLTIVWLGGTRDISKFETYKSVFKLD